MIAGSRLTGILRAGDDNGNLSRGEVISSESKNNSTSICSLNISDFGLNSLAMSVPLVGVAPASFGDSLITAWFSDDFD
jgi:hypothetical protein